VYLFVPYSTAGHVHPVLPVIAELARRGAVVRILIGERFAPAVRATGAIPVLLDSVPDVFVPDGLSGARRFLLGRARRPYRNALSGRLLARELRRRPDLVVLDPMLGWADRVVRRARIRSALFSTTFADGPAVRAVTGAGGRRMAHLLPTVRRHLRPGRLVLAHALPELQPAAETLPAAVRLVAPLIRADRTDLAFTDPPVPVGSRLLYVSPGTVFARAPRFFRAIGEAFENRPWFVVLATGPYGAGDPRPMPTNIWVSREVPQLRMLRRCDVFLTHAGMNSAVEGLAAGVPMALAPRSAEQRFIARQLVGLGVAAYAEIDRQDPELLYRDLTALADDSGVRAASDAWRLRLAGTDGATLAADLLGAELSEGNPTGREA
jgi:UDP:flavonoid glycosyltransferase YjiC (YdhE family)